MASFMYCLAVFTGTPWPPRSVYSLDYYRKNFDELSDKATLTGINFFYFVKEIFIAFALL